MDQFIDMGGGLRAHRRNSSSKILNTTGLTIPHTLTKKGRGVVGSKQMGGGTPLVILYSFASSQSGGNMYLQVRSSSINKALSVSTSLLMVKRPGILVQ